MPIDLTKIVSQQDTGTSDMGSLAFGRTIDATVDDNHKARFWIPDQKFFLLSVRIHFSLGTGTSTNFVINVDSGLGEAHDAALMTIVNAGTDGDDIHFRVSEEELRAGHWMFDVRDKVVFTWTNPNDGTMRWGADVRLGPLDALVPA